MEIKIPKDLFKREPGKTLSFVASPELVRELERLAKEAKAKSLSSYIAILLNHIVLEKK